MASSSQPGSFKKDASFKGMDGSSFKRRMTVEESALGGQIISTWIKAAPRAAARAYVSRIQCILPEAKLSAASLLFDSKVTELSVRIPKSMVGFTIVQLRLPKGAIVVVSRHNAEGKEQDLGPQQKFNEGDELVLKGKPHVLAMHVAGASHSHAPTLLKPMEVEGMRSSLAGEREALVLAAQELHDRLLPCVRRKQLEWARRRLEEGAAIRIQNRARGKQARAKTSPHLDRIRRRKLMGCLATRKMMAVFSRQRLNGPILSGAVLKRLALPPDDLAARALDDLDMDGGGAASIFKNVYMARRVRVARAHEATVNKMLSAAPEASGDGNGLKLPMRLIDILLGKEVTVTCRVPCELVFESLQLPADVKCTKYGHEGAKNMKQVKGGRVDPKLKLFKGDEVTLKALPHRLGLISEVKGGRLCVSREHRTAEAEALQKGRELLITVLTNMATQLQAAVRRQIAVRAHGRRWQAALLIQYAFFQLMLRQVDAGTRVMNERMSRRMKSIKPGAPPPSEKKKTRRPSVGWAQIRAAHKSKMAAVLVFNSVHKKVKQKRKPNRAKRMRMEAEAKAKEQEAAC